MNALQIFLLLFALNIFLLEMAVSRNWFTKVIRHD